MTRQPEFESLETLPILEGAEAKHPDVAAAGVNGHVPVKATVKASSAQESEFMLPE